MLYMDSFKAWRPAHAARPTISIREEPGRSAMVTVANFTLASDLPCDADTTVRIIFTTVIGDAVDTTDLYTGQYKFQTPLPPKLKAEPDMADAAVASGMPSSQPAARLTGKTDTALVGGRAKERKDDSKKRKKEEEPESSICAIATDNTCHWKTHSAEERRFLISKVIPLAVAPIDPNIDGPTQEEILRRVLSKVNDGKLAKTSGGQIDFQIQDCVLMRCTGPDKRSALRIDLKNFAHKAMPHAILYKLFRDPKFDVKDWQKMRRVSGCQMGYNGQQHGGWNHKNYCCCNPFHYTIEGEAPLPLPLPVHPSEDPARKKRRTDDAGDQLDQATASGDGAGGAAAGPGGADAGQKPLSGVASEQELSWLLKSVHPSALVGMDMFRQRPEARQILKRLTDKVAYGFLTKAVGRDLSFEKKKCVLVNCTHDSRSTIRMDISNFHSKCWPHALAYRMFRDPLFQMNSWKSLVSKGGCPYGYTGRYRNGGSRGWINDEFVCINPFHYEVEERRDRDPMKRKQAAAALALAEAKAAAAKSKLPALGLKHMVQGEEPSSRPPREAALERVPPKQALLEIATTSADPGIARMLECPVQSGMLARYFGEKNNLHFIRKGRIEMLLRDRNIILHLSAGSGFGSIGFSHPNVEYRVVEPVELCTFPPEAAVDLYGNHFEAYANLIAIVQATNTAIDRETSTSACVL